MWVITSVLAVDSLYLKLYNIKMSLCLFITYSEVTISVPQSNLPGIDKRETTGLVKVAAELNTSWSLIVSILHPGRLMRYNNKR